MLERTFMQDLLHWKKNRGKECLLIKGARQIGKTFLVREFGKKYYESVIEINFEEQPDLKNIFSGELTPKFLKQQMSLFLPGIRFIPGKTLLFLDEIQSCPQARTALKFLAEDTGLDVIATGSLLGINYKAVSSFPVGYERQVRMHGLSFEEFLYAVGVDKNSLDLLRGYYAKREKVPAPIHEKMMQYLRTYMVVGGMPAVVQKFIDTDNYNEVQAQQQMILDTYLNDMEKYAETPEKPKIRSSYLSIPRQLAKENHKFQFSVVEKRGNARKFGSSLEWLRDAELVQFCYNVQTPSFPLRAYEKEDQFKLYMTDTGLLISLYGYQMKRAVMQDTLGGAMKGGIYENLIGDMLTKKNIPLHYYSKNSGQQEIEFLLEKNGQVIPVEVKAKNGPSASLDRLLASGQVPYGYKLISGNVGTSGNKITLPLYMAMFLDEE